MPLLLRFPLKFLGRSCSFWSWLLKVRKFLCRVVYFWLMYICILFWRNNIHALFFFWHILLLVPACLELMVWEFDGKSHAFSKPKHFPCDEVYYSMGIWLEKCTHTMGKVWLPISQAFSRVLLHFPVLWEIDGETHAFFMWWGIPEDWYIMEKSTHTMEKIWELISQALPIWWFLLNFLMLLQID